MTARGWVTSIWYGSQYVTRQRIVRLDSLRYIFACPQCEYRMTARDEDGIRTLRRMHARTVHPRSVATVDLLDEAAALL